MALTSHEDKLRSQPSLWLQTTGTGGGAAASPCRLWPRQLGTAGTELARSLGAAPTARAGFLPRAVAIPSVTPAAVNLRAKQAPGFIPNIEFFPLLLFGGFS